MTVASALAAAGREAGHGRAPAVRTVGDSRRRSRADAVVYERLRPTWRDARTSHGGSGRGRTERATLEATHRALREDGYAGPSVQDVADRLERSNSAIHSHYDSKDDVLLSPLDYVVETFFEELEAETGADPVENLRLLVDRLVPVPFDDEDRDLHAVTFELRSEPLTTPDYRAKFTEVDRTVCRIVADSVRAAVEDGDVEDVDPEAAARRIQQHALSAQTARPTTEDLGRGDAREAALDLLGLP